MEMEEVEIRASQRNAQGRGGGVQCHFRNRSFFIRTLFLHKRFVRIDLMLCCHRNRRPKGKILPDVLST